MKKLWLVAAMLIAGYALVANQWSPRPHAAPAATVERSAGRSDARIARAFSNRERGVQVAGEGVVVKLLPDDIRGSRHQRFILRLKSGQTLLLAHNIDLAPRIDRLRIGDTVRFYGEYEWNEKGGVLHWTHRDPKGMHAHGWLQYHGRRYE